MENPRLKIESDWKCTEVYIDGKQIRGGTMIDYYVDDVDYKNIPQERYTETDDFINFVSMKFSENAKKIRVDEIIELIKGELKQYG